MNVPESSSSPVQTLEISKLEDRTTENVKESLKFLKNLVKRLKESKQLHESLSESVEFCREVNCKRQRFLKNPRASCSNTRERKKKQKKKTKKKKKSSKESSVADHVTRTRIRANCTHRQETLQTLASRICGITTSATDRTMEPEILLVSAQQRPVALNPESLRNDRNCSCEFLRCMVIDRRIQHRHTISTNIKEAWTSAWQMKLDADCTRRRLDVVEKIPR